MCLSWKAGDDSLRGLWLQKSAERIPGKNTICLMKPVPPATAGLVKTVPSAYALSYWILSMNPTVRR